MIVWINITVLPFSIAFFIYFYVKSVGIAALEQEIGEKAYKKCAQYRLAASVFMGIAGINYVVYYFYPFSVLPQRFPWDYWVSAMIAVTIAVPGGYLWLKGMKDAGEETMNPKKEHVLYTGIYTEMRHPQAVGGVTYWWVIAFLLNSPFLALFSFVWIPVYYAMCLAEEKDLMLRYGQKYKIYKKNTGFFFTKNKN